MNQAQKKRNIEDHKGCPKRSVNLKVQILEKDQLGFLLSTEGHRGALPTVGVLGERSVRIMAGNYASVLLLI